MLFFPDRIGQLMRLIEAGEPITQADLDRIAALQALDIAKAGEDFVRQAVAADRAASEALEQL